MLVLIFSGVIQFSLQDACFLMIFTGVLRYLKVKKNLQFDSFGCEALVEQFFICRMKDFF